MELKMAVQFDEDKLRELVAEAVERLKAEGYIWRDNPPPQVNLEASETTYIFNCGGVEDE